MKEIFKNYVICTTALYFTSQMFEGLTILGGLNETLFAGLFLTLGFLLIRPILTIITLPLNIVTFGMFSIVINMLIIYLVTVVYPQVSITQFTFPQVSFLGITVSSFHVSTILSYFIISATIYAISRAIDWLFE